MQPIPDTCSIYQKINYIEIRKWKNNFILSVEMSIAFSDAFNLKFYATQWRVSAVTF